MTKKQAIKGLKENLCSLCAYGSQNMDSCDIRECDNRDYIKALEQQPCEDCVSRKELLKLYGNRAFELQKTHQTDKQLGIYWCINTLNELPPVTPAHCIAEVRFSKDDLREICNERIEVECTHGTCKDCRNYVKGALDEDICQRGHELIHEDFYCADFEKRGNENESK